MSSRLHRLRRFALGLATACVLAGCERSTPNTPGDTATRDAHPLEALSEASGWLGASATYLDSLRGHPVLLVAWSDTDPRSLRLLRDADAWRMAYGRFGLRVAGVHVPEYAFASDSGVPARALRRIGVSLPVALDAGSRVSTRLGAGDELPLWLLVRSDGVQTFVARGDQRGAVEHAVLELLRRERRESPSSPAAQPRPTATTFRRIYCGTARVAGGPILNSPAGEPQTFTAQFRYQEQGVELTPYPVGRWTPSADGITSVRGGAADYVAMRYAGGRLDAVLGAATPTRVWVMCDDGWLPATQRGEDVRMDSHGSTFIEVDEPRPYAIARGDSAHVVRLSPEASGVTLYEFSVERN